MTCTNVSVRNHTCPIEPQPVFLPVLICLILMLGFVLNIFSMWVFKYRTLDWKSGTVLQFHLAISDLIVCPLAPFLTVYFALGHWPFGSLMCRLKIFLLITHLFGSIFFLTLISIHRYVSVVYHSQEFRMKQKDFVKKVCIGVWAFLLIQGLVCGVLLDVKDVGNRTLCFSIHQEPYTGMYFFANFILVIPGFLIPFTISLVCYSRLVKSMSSIKLCHQKGKFIKSKSCKMVAICLLIFGLCFTPLNVTRTVLVAIKKFFPDRCDLLLKMETCYYSSYILSSANCCLDPLIYCFASQNFRAALHSSLRKIGVRFQTTREDIELDSGLSKHYSPTPRIIKRGNMKSTHL